MDSAKAQQIVDASKTSMGMDISEVGAIAAPPFPVADQHEALVTPTFFLLLAD
jgi:hypothetical protein